MLPANYCSHGALGIARRPGGPAALAERDAPVDLVRPDLALALDKLIVGLQPALQDFRDGKSAGLPQSCEGLLGILVEPS